MDRLQTVNVPKANPDCQKAVITGRGRRSKRKQARLFLRHYRIPRLTPEIAHTAAQVDRELIQAGARLGENDTWIAGFARYYGQPLISRDQGFGRVAGLRRLSY